MAMDAKPAMRSERNFMMLLRMFCDDVIVAASSNGVV
jgi:hypothetical protein